MLVGSIVKHVQRGASPTTVTNKQKVHALSRGIHGIWPGSRKRNVEVVTCYELGGPNYLRYSKAGIYTDQNVVRFLAIYSSPIGPYRQLRHSLAKNNPLIGRVLNPGPRRDTSATAVRAETNSPCPIVTEIVSLNKRAIRPQA